MIHSSSTFDIIKLKKTNGRIYTVTQKHIKNGQILINIYIHRYCNKIR